MATTKTVTSDTLRESIDKAVAGSTPDVVDAVVENFVNQEVNQRTQLVVGALTKLKSMDDELKKVRPDQVFFDVDGNETQASFSKAKLDEKKKLTEKRDKLAAAIEKALGKDRDFEALKKASEGS